MLGFEFIIFCILNSKLMSILCADIMASSLVSSGDKMALKPIVFKFQGIPSKSRLKDDYLEIKDIDLGHTNLGDFLNICNKPTKKSTMVSTLI